MRDYESPLIRDWLKVMSDPNYSDFLKWEFELEGQDDA